MARSFQIWSALQTKWCSYTPGELWMAPYVAIRTGIYCFLWNVLPRNKYYRAVGKFGAAVGGAVLNGECCRAGWVWRSCIAVVRILHSLVVRSSLRSTPSRPRFVTIPSHPCHAATRFSRGLIVCSSHGLPWQLGLGPWWSTKDQTGRARTRTLPVLQ